MNPKRLFAIAAILVLHASLAAASPLPPAEEAAAFQAAGFTQKGRLWHSSCGDPGTPSYMPGAIAEVRDLNGDGRPEAMITEGGTTCYGEAGVGFTIVGKQADGSWKKIASGDGVATFLSTKGDGGWPDIEIGGPGFCFPVLRWNGHDYAEQRHEYEGKPCKAR